VVAFQTTRVSVVEISGGYRALFPQKGDGK
jgi:hypothetical protein